MLRCILSMPETSCQSCRTSPEGYVYHTLVSELHFHFQCLELVRLFSLDLAAHTLSRPLLHAVEPLGDVHDGGCGAGSGVIVSLLSQIVDIIILTRVASE